MHHTKSYLRKTLLTVSATACLLGCTGTPMPVEELLSEPTAETPARDAAVTFGSNPGGPRTGVLTAGDIDDALNFAAFQRYAKKAAVKTGFSKTKLRRPIRAQLRGVFKPMPGVPFSLYKPGATEPFFSGQSGVNGHITVFPSALGVNVGSTVDLKVFADHPVNTASQGFQHSPSSQLSSRNLTWKIRPGAAREQLTVDHRPYDPDFLDLVFVIDATGSMADELEWLTKDLNRLISRIRKEANGIDIRLGLVVYRDHGDEFVVRNYGFTKDRSQIRRQLRKQEAVGGGDYPEAADAALAAAIDLRWRRGNGERLVFHIADAPAQAQNASAYLAAAKTAAQRNVQVFGIGASGVGSEAEYLMRQAALMTGGRYVFLTDDSGVGHSHAEPSIACYRVTRLTNLIGRILASEVTGIRQEASPREILRRVGTYREGRCIT